MRNGQLASGSHDYTIKLWNLESRQCVQTLLGDTDRICKLRALLSGELVSCSGDSYINIWNKTEIIRTLVGHTNFVGSIRLNSQNNTLVSCSYDGTIKTWHLNTSECLNTILVEKKAHIRDLILI